MVRAHDRTLFLIASTATLVSLFGPTSSLGVTPPMVLNSDLLTCECYQEEVYPSDCPQSTPQLDEVCSNPTAYEYDQALTQQFCSQSCLDALTSCYQQHPENCSADVLQYYTSSFCSQNEEGEYCVSVGISALEQLASLSVTSCSAANDVCAPPPATCSPSPCPLLLTAVRLSLGCCAPSLFDDSLSPFTNFSIGNPSTYATCSVTLGEKCPVYVEPSPVPTLSTSSPVPALSTALTTPSPTAGNGCVSIVSFTVLTLAFSVVAALCSI